MHQTETDKEFPQNKKLIVSISMQRLENKIVCLTIVCQGKKIFASSIFLLILTFIPFNNDDSIRPVNKINGQNISTVSPFFGFHSFFI